MTRIFIKTRQKVSQVLLNWKGSLMGLAVGELMTMIRWTTAMARLVRLRRRRPRRTSKGTSHSLAVAFCAYDVRRRHSVATRSLEPEEGDWYHLWNSLSRFWFSGRGWIPRTENTATGSSSNWSRKSVNTHDAKSQNLVGVGASDMKIELRYMTSKPA